MGAVWETGALAVGRAVVAKAAAVWLSDRSARRQQGAELTELMRVRFGDVFQRRTVDRKLEAVADDVAQRLAGLCQVEFRDLVDNEKNAALEAVAGTFAAAGLPDEVIFAADADPVILTAALRRQAGAVLASAALSEAGTAFYELVLAESVTCLLTVVVALPPFGARAAVEILGRLPTLNDQVSQALARLPVRSVEAPAGTDLDTDFGRRYLREVAAELDVLEMPGLTTRRYRPRTTLSVAYLSLSVAARDQARGRRRGRKDADGWEAARWREEPGRSGAGAREDDEAAVRVEHALAGAPRLLIRGAPGSGKTTLLHWLAVTASRSGFDGELREWNGSVPFLLTLRRHTEGPLPAPEALVGAVAPMNAALQPPGWAHRVLAEGRGLLLVDGVDEVAESRRNVVRVWLRQLLREFPTTRVVVTSRPAAAGRDWLRELGFATAVVEQMTPTEVRVFLHRWHQAAADAAQADATTLPCPVEELPRYEAALVAHLETAPHLRTLAANPLLCALLCALNLDRHTQLPRDRMGVYRAALEMLLERRDAEREITADTPPVLDARDKATVLRGIAWWLSLEGRADLPVDRALDLLRSTLSGMPTITIAAEELLRHLLARSGVIREPAVDRVDFVHRTFQEYLAAQEAADSGHVGMLVERAHLDQWRETIIMAVGHGNKQFRHDLFSGLLERAVSEPRHARHLRLLATACLETVPTLDKDLLVRIDAELQALLPPRRKTEARALAAAGSHVLRHLPASLEGLGIGAAVATVRTAALIAGPDTLPVLARYATDARSAVARELIRAWDYHPPEEYAKQVLAESPLDDGTLTLTSRTKLNYVRHLGRLRRLTLDLTDDQIHDLTWLNQVPSLHELDLDASRLRDLTGLAAHPELERLTLRADDLDLDTLPDLPKLVQMYLAQRRFTGGLEFLLRYPTLKVLSLFGLPTEVDFTPLVGLRDLRGIFFTGAPGPAMTVLRQLPRIDSLTLNVGEGDFSLAEIAATWRKLEFMQLLGCEWLTDLEPLADLPLRFLGLQGTRTANLEPLSGIDTLKMLHIIDAPNLVDLTSLKQQATVENLYLRQVPVADLTPLSSVVRLAHITLDSCEQVEDLRPLARLPKLRSITLVNAKPGIDLSPFTGRRVTIHLDKNQEFAGVGSLTRWPRIELLD